MKKHTLLTGLVAAAIMVVGTWGSMQCVYAGTTIEVIPAGAGNNLKTSASTKKAVAVASGVRQVAEAEDSGIVIEIVHESDIDSTSTSTGSVAGIPYNKLVMANVEEAVNIRDSASEEGKLIGKFYKECAGTVVEKGDGWTKVETGNITGWIRNDFLMFDDKAVELAQKVVEKTATCTTDCLRVRKSADSEGTVLDLLAEGDQIGVLSEQGEWVEVEYSDGEVGFVSSEYVSIEDTLGTGRSMEEIAAMEEAERRSREAVVAEIKLNDTVESPSNTSSNEIAMPTVQAATPVSCDDLTLLAALIQAEAGSQPYEGQVAVGNVVTNRLKSGRYGNSLYSVIYAKSQFGPAGSGKVAQIIATGPNANCVKAAQDALNGVNYVGTAMHFRNIKSGYQGLVIGAHVFW